MRQALHITGSLLVLGGCQSFFPDPYLGADGATMGGESVDAGLDDARPESQPEADAGAQDVDLPTDAGTSPLELLDASPTANELDVPLGAAIHLLFSAPVDPSTVNAGSLWLANAHGSPVASTVAVVQASVTLTPTNALTPDSTYTVHLAAAVSDDSGNALGSARTWSFSTVHVADATAPHIISTSPLADASQVSVDTPVEVLFSEPMNASCLATALSLRDADGNAVVASVGVVGSSATLTPVHPLRKESAYSAQLLGTACDLAGNTLGVDTSWSFSTENKSWGPPELVEFDTDHSVFLGRVAVDAAGNAIAAWEQHDGARYNLWAARYRVDQGWDPPQLIENIDTGSVHISSLFVDADGDAIVAWSQEVAGIRRIAANVFDVDSGWGQAELIDVDTGNGQEYPQVAFDSSGGAIAVWEEHVNTGDGFWFNVWWNRYEPGTGWSTAAPLEDHDAGSVLGETVVPDGVGGLMAIWTHSYGNPDASVWSRRYLPGTGWLTPEVIVPYNPTTPRAYYTPEVAFDASGRGLAVAQGSVGVAAMTYQPGTGWSAPSPLWPNDGSFVRAPRLAMNSGGQAMVVFVRDPGDGYDVWSRSYDPASGWAAAQLVADDTADLSFIRHDVGIDDHGNATAIWARPSYPQALYSRQFDPQQGWGPSELIDAPNTQRPQLAVDRDGNAIAFWPKSGPGGYSMWAARRD